MEDNLTTQICGYKTASKGLFAQFKCTPTPAERPFQVHDGEEKNSDGSRNYSTIGISILDYSEKGNTKMARINLSPLQIKRLYADAFIRKENVELKIDKIYGVPNAEGRSFMDKTLVKRASVGPDGTTRKLPWYVEIDNGSAIPAKSQTGGTYCQSGSYKSSVKLFINLSDDDFFAFITKIYTELTGWETAVAAARLIETRPDIFAGAFAKLTT